MSTTVHLDRRQLLVAHVFSQIYRKKKPLIAFAPADKPLTASEMSWSETKWHAYICNELADSSSVLAAMFAASLNVSHLAKRLAKELCAWMDWAHAHQAHTVTYHDACYPKLLRMIPDAPWALSVQGDLERLLDPQVAVIGSRRASLRSLKESECLSRGLAMRGVTVVSGGAFGCDIAAHLGTMQEQLPYRSIAVMAGGLARYYPQTNLKTFQAMIEHGGLLVSERLPFQTPRPYDFPIRNRIISGMAMRLFVMHADQKSGAMVTANVALDQGRDVWVLAHPETDQSARGSHQLIADGAQTFSSAENFLATLEECDQGLVATQEWGSEPCSVG